MILAMDASMCSRSFPEGAKGPRWKLMSSRFCRVHKWSEWRKWTGGRERSDSLFTFLDGDALGFFARWLLR